MSTGSPVDAVGAIAVSGDAVRMLTLSRPETLNALDAELHTGLLRELDRAAADERVRAIIVTGSGRAFCAGGDMDLIRTMQRDRKMRHETLETGRRLFSRFVDLDVPVIAAVNGPAVGGGCTLALLCDVVFLAEDAYLADPHVNIGLVPGDGGAVLWPALAGLPAARAYLLTGDRLAAQEAHRIGLVHKVVAADVVVAEAERFAARIAALPASAVRDTKRALNLHLAAAAATTFEVGLQAEARSFDTAEHQQLTADDRLP